MSSLEFNDTIEPGSRTGTLRRLLDPAFGLFVWAVHFLAVYIGAAVACVLGLGTANPGIQTTFLTVLVILTAVAAAVVLAHAIWRYGQFRDFPNQRFRMILTIGNGGIATVAIIWQIFPVLLVPVCT